MRHPPFLDSFFSPTQKVKKVRRTHETPKTPQKNSKKKYAKKKKKKRRRPSFLLFLFGGRRRERKREERVFFRRGRVSSSRRLFYSIGRARERATPRGEGREGGGEYVVNVLGERNAFTTSTRDEEDEDDDDDALLDRARIFCESLDRRVVSSRVRQRRGERKDVGWK